MKTWTWEILVLYVEACTGCIANTIRNLPWHKICSFYHPIDDFCNTKMGSNCASAFSWEKEDFSTLLVKSFTFLLKRPSNTLEVKQQSHRRRLCSEMSQPTFEKIVDFDRWNYNASQTFQKYIVWVAYGKYKGLILSSIVLFQDESLDRFKNLVCRHSEWFFPLHFFILPELSLHTAVPIIETWNSTILSNKPKKVI